jgi:hypothetical protein
MFSSKTVLLLSIPYQNTKNLYQNKNTVLDKPGQEKNYEMCESRAEINKMTSKCFKNMIYLWSVHLNGVRQTF